VYKISDHSPTSLFDNPFTQIGQKRKLKKIYFQFISDYIPSLSFAYPPVLSAPADLCNKFNFFMRLNLSEVPLTSSYFVDDFHSLLLVVVVVTLF
jgi:hypothetical protein